MTMTLKELDQLLNSTLANWRRDMATGNYDELTKLMENGNLADGVIELREAIADLSRHKGEEAKKAGAGDLDNFSVDRLLFIGTEEVIDAHRIIEAMRRGKPVEGRLVHDNRSDLDAQMDKTDAAKAEKVAKADAKKKRDI